MSLKKLKAFLFFYGLLRAPFFLIGIDSASPAIKPIVSEEQQSFLNKNYDCACYLGIFFPYIEKLHATIALANDDTRILPNCNTEIQKYQYNNSRSIVVYPTYKDYRRNPQHVYDDKNGLYCYNLIREKKRKISHNPIQEVKISPDGKYIIYRYLKELFPQIYCERIKVYDTKSNCKREITPSLPAPIICFTISSGNQVAILFGGAGRDFLDIYNLNSRNLNRRERPMNLEIPQTIHIEFNQDNKLVLKHPHNTFSLYNTDTSMFEQFRPETEDDHVKKIDPFLFSRSKKFSLNPDYFLQEYKQATQEQKIFISFLIGLQQALKDRHESRKESEGHNYTHKKPMPTDFDLVAKYNKDIGAADLHRILGSFEGPMRQGLVRKFNIVRKKAPFFQNFFLRRTTNPY